MARECLRCGFCRSKVWSKYFYSLLIGKNIRKFPTMELIDLVSLCVRCRLIPDARHLSHKTKYYAGLTRIYIPTAKDLERLRLIVGGALYAPILKIQSYQLLSLFISYAVYTFPELPPKHEAKKYVKTSVSGETETHFLAKLPKLGETGFAKGHMTYSSLLVI
ncbi:hypothetical protein RhiirA5_382357 [Rhizophagus irregularis]|uniref:Uncharacterized protein n=1 Tax=Rhizophagus irregularis TaxID=588596 RepID=A0A2N0P158_9GLOM|nr:hypothetical protein RhiirA5_382357 [Rhizophagus irregularis]